MSFVGRKGRRESEKPDESERHYGENATMRVDTSRHWKTPVNILEG
jgi:hypothetical protein